MRIRRIRVENVRCYDEADLELTEGVTVVHGENGSGKTTLLEACFFALYGARALEETLEGFVATGAEDAEVELWFDHGGAEYRVERRIRATGERPTTAKCVLETPDDVVEGARDVRAAIVDLLRMDAEAFVNCAYVRQGEVNALLHATPAERQATIDDLLQLGALEAYRDRAGDARLAVEDALGEVRGELTGVEEQVAEKEDADLHERLNELESERTAVVEEIEHVEAQIEQAEATRDDAREVIEAYEETREELADLREGIDDLGERISETDEEREALRDRLGELREQREAARDRRDELLAESELDVADDGAGPEAAAGVALEAVEEELAEVCERDDELRDELEAQRLAIQELSGEAESAAERAEEFESEAEAKRGEADDLDAELEDDEETLAERREKLEGLESELEDRRSAFEDAPVDTEGAAEHEQGVADGLGELEDERSDLRAELEATADRIERAEELLEAGKCPECGQPVEDSPHVDSLAELREDRESIADRIEALDAERADVEERLERAEELVEAADAIDRLEERRGDLRQLLEEREASIEDKRERVQTLRETAEELEAEVESERETAEAKREAADDEREAIAALNRERKALGEREERLEALAECIEDVADLGEEIEAVRERRELLAEQNEERRETLRERRERASELEDEADEQRVEAARDDLERAEEYLEEAEAELADRRERRDDLQGLVGGVENEIEELEALRERAAALSEERDALESLQAEATTLESTYGDLRAELRQRNVEQLERLLNETFDLVYRNDAYDRIELSGDYELAVYQKDGEPLEPGQLSGGERALFNLSLRCAIYRLLAEGIEGTAPMPPLILDEPTVFLDAGHVSQLVELIDAMTDLGVEQILVVSHDEELLGAADELLRVRKDATTNRSSVEREPVAAAALLD